MRDGLPFFVLLMFRCIGYGMFRCVTAGDRNSWSRVGAGVLWKCIDFYGFGYIILQRSIIYRYPIQDRRRQDVRMILFQR